MIEVSTLTLNNEGPCRAEPSRAMHSTRRCYCAEPCWDVPCTKGLFRNPYWFPLATRPSAVSPHSMLPCPGALSNKGLSEGGSPGVSIEVQVPSQPSPRELGTVRDMCGLGSALPLDHIDDVCCLMLWGTASA